MKSFHVTANCIALIPILIATLAGTLAQPEPIRAGPTVVLGRSVPPGDRIPVERIDHASWTALLLRYVDTSGMVDYAAWKSSESDMQALENYLGQLSAASFSPQSDDKATLAFWINAYNAVTVKGILREYPTTSIRNHTPRLFGYNIWNDLQLQVDGHAYSLDQIEHQVLRKLSEPRIHFAIVCASVGCPRLLADAYTTEKLDEQLTANARAFFADPNKFQYDAEQRTLAVSPILDWFGEDFGANQAEQLRRIAPLLPDVAAQQLAESGNAKVSFLDYDWNLNDQASALQSEPR